MSEEKKTFYKTLNNIVATKRIDNEEIYIINNYISSLENIIEEARRYLINTNFDSDLPELLKILDEENKC